MKYFRIVEKPVILISEIHSLYNPVQMQIYIDYLIKLEKTLK